MPNLQVGSTYFSTLNHAANADIQAGVAGSTIVVTGLCITMSGTAPTLTFADGVGNVTGPFTPTTGSVISIKGSRSEPLFACSPGTKLAVTITGTTPLIAGFITYMILPST